MKKVIKIIAFFSFISIFCITLSFADNISSEIERAFSSGRSDLLSQHFDDHIELSINGSNNYYSKNQAKQILSDFFSQNKPVRFIENNFGERSGAKFILGTLKTNKGNYNVSLLLRDENGKMKIHQLSFEKDNGF